MTAPPTHDENHGQSRAFSDFGALPRFLSPWEWLSLVVPLLLAAVVHLPSLGLGFAGDDFQWWQHARMAVERPSLLLAPYASYRPTNTWSLAANYLLFATDPTGYHATNLCLHLACGALLWFLCRRLDLSAPARAAVVVLWACSPFSLEPVQWVNTRYNLVLLALWLGIALLWPRPGTGWSGRRLAAVIALAVLSALTSESWVVLPGLVACFELLLARAPLRRTLLATGAAGIAVIAYVVVYFTHPPIQPGVYYAGGLTAMAKLPHAWAALSYLTTLRPLDFPLGGPEWLALASMATLAWVAWRRRSSTIALGLALFVLPFVPVLPVGFMTTRYTAIPLVGFLVAVAGGVSEGLTALPPTLRKVGSSTAAVLVLLALAANLVWLRADLEDAHAYSLANARLVAEARAFLPRLERGRPLVAVRRERINLPAELAPASRGIPKLYYPRHGDPYSLADWGAVLSYVLDHGGGPILVKAAPETQAVVPFEVIAHVDGGFEELPSRADTARSAADEWRSLGFQTCVLVPWRAPAGPAGGR